MPTEKNIIKAAAESRRQIAEAEVRDRQAGLAEVEALRRQPHHDEESIELGDLYQRSGSLDRLEARLSAHRAKHAEILSVAKPQSAPVAELSIEERLVRDVLPLDSDETPAQRRDRLYGRSDRAELSRFYTRTPGARRITDAELDHADRLADQVGAFAKTLAEPDKE